MNTTAGTYRLAVGLLAALLVAGCAESGADPSDPWRLAGPGPDTAFERDSSEDEVAPDRDGECAPSRSEVCNGADDDCDGAVDEGLSRDCPQQLGVCRGAEVRCRGGRYPTCDPSAYGSDYTPDEDSADCDGKDNDCDGTIDEGCVCNPGSTEPCYPANSATRGVGVCSPGTKRCQSGEGWGECRGAVTPRPETCNEMDDDCDGVTDETCPCNYRGKLAGVCEERQRTDDGTCPAPPDYEMPTDNESSCDGEDNDCDGAVDEGCECDFQSTSRGVCSGMTRAPDGECRRPAEFEANELDRSDGLDNDCDGQVDERSHQRVSAGNAYGCAIETGGAATCWGFGPTQPASASFVQVTAGPYHACGVTTSGAVECWGNSKYIPPGWTGTGFEQISSSYHTCVLRSSGSVACWGPTGSTKSNPPSGTFLQVVAGGTFSCGLTPGGSITCWGYDKNGETDPPSGTFVDLAAGNTFGCAIAADGHVECWGAPGFGRLQPPSGSFRDLGAGPDHICGVKSSDDVVCWGRDVYGETQPPSGSFVEVSGGTDHTCGRTVGGRLQCWGRDDHGESTPPNVSVAP